VTRYVHPELRAIARMIQKMTADPPPSIAGLAKMRANNAGFGRPRLSDVPVEKREIAGRPGQPAVVIYIINAKPGESRPGILHTHGGGFVAGSAESSVADVQAACKELGCAAVSVEYRLAPETTYAGSLEDNYAALKWLHANASQLGVDPARLAVMGESAGGGHAALLAITARDRGEVPLKFQALIYPMLDDRTGSTRRAPAHVGKIIWTPEGNAFGWRSFLGVEPGGGRVPVRAVPARTVDLAGLPPAFIGVGTLDLFHDEDIEYARRLNDAAVPTELIVVPGAFHGFDALPAKISSWFNAAKFAALRQGLGLSGA
jgi:acetyl esterase/lipase